MDEITLQSLLEAGCHFGHKAERWHPKAADFIWTAKDGIHIIDLAKTKAGLEAAMAFVRETVEVGGEVLFVGTKRQASGIVKELAERAGAPYLTERWIGGFLTNWDSVHANINKINRLAEEQVAGVWKKFPKHEQVKLARYLEKLKIDYGGVLSLSDVPAALYIVDIRKEATVVREALRRGIPIVAIVDTNSDPTVVDYPIPGNDDAVGSIQYITEKIAVAYELGKKAREKAEEKKAVPEVTQKPEKEEKAEEPAKSPTKEEKPAAEKKKPVSTKPARPSGRRGRGRAAAGKRGRPKES